MYNSARNGAADTSGSDLVGLHSDDDFEALTFSCLCQVHDGPLGAEDTRHVKSVLGFDPDASFAIPQEVGEYYQQAGRKAAGYEAAWQATWRAYKADRPRQAAEYERRFIRKELPEGWFQRLPRWKAVDPAEATR